MEQELTKEVGLQVNAQYQRLKELLLSSSSYERNPQIHNMNNYLFFVENALEQGIDRIMHIHFFIDRYSDLSDIMYPFSHLNETTKQKIQSIYLYRYLDYGRIRT